MKKIILAYSGGLDTSYCLKKLSSEGNEVHAININTGELNWMKNNKYPFNSEIKKNKGKIFVIDYKNTLHCYKIFDGISK